MLNLKHLETLLAPAEPGPWIDHDGGGRPHPPTTFVEVEYRNGKTACTDSAMVEVTQADREAAITFGQEAIVWRFFEGNERDMRAGSYDDERLIQAFARHRLAASPPPVTGGEGALREALHKVANVRKIGGTADQHTCVIMENIAIDALRSIPATVESEHHPFPQGTPPEPVSHPNEDWCERYAAWYENRKYRA